MSDDGPQCGYERLLMGVEQLGLVTVHQGPEIALVDVLGQTLLFVAMTAGCGVEAVHCDISTPRALASNSSQLRSATHPVCRIRSGA